MISEIVVDYIIKHIISSSRKLINEHKVEAKIPDYLRINSMQQIRSAINLYQVNVSHIDIPIDDQEYFIKPKIDSFQALTLKLIEKPFFEPPPLSVTSTSKSLTKKITIKKKCDVSVTKIEQIQNLPHIEQQQEQEELLYKKQINTNNQYSMALKQHIKELTKHMRVDNFDPNEFRKKLQNQAEQIEREIKQLNIGNHIKKPSEKSFDLANSTTLSKPSTAKTNVRRQQQQKQLQSLEMNNTMQQIKRELTPLGQSKPPLRKRIYSVH